MDEQVSEVNKAVTNFKKSSLRHTKTEVKDYKPTKEGVCV